MRTALLMVTLAAAVSFAACSKKEEIDHDRHAAAGDVDPVDLDDRRDDAARRFRRCFGRDVRRHGRDGCR